MTKPVFLYVALPCALFFGFQETLKAQAVKVAASAENSAFKKTEDYFNQTLGQQTRLYNGKEYQFYFGLEGLAYYKEDKFDKKGWVNYDGFNFENVPLLYDLYKDLLVSLLPNGVTKYSLLSEKITAFEIHNHYFVRLDADQLAQKPPFQTGFFEVLYDGKNKIFAKRYNVLQETAGTQALKRYFIPKNAYYLKKGETYSVFTSERTFLNLFKERKKELQRYLKDNKIKFKQDMEYAAVQLIAYYESLTN